MEQALQERQFIVYLQPKHDISTGAVAGAEALVRWRHPELGFISPGEFIPLFERSGFITKLDRYVWEEVCRTLRRWMDEGHKLIPISANASRADFNDRDLPQCILNMVERYDIPTHLFHLEVTESAYTDNPQKMISMVSTLRDMGFLVEMDDFDSWYSSLNMLSELPIDILKLDMRFMQSGSAALPNNKRSVLNFIISLSKWLQLPTVAEGVETKEDVELLKAMGCNYIQGYYFAKPMPVTAFEEYVGQLKEPSAEPVSSANRLQFPNVTDSDTPKSGDSALPCVLVVEDVAANRQLLEDILSPYYSVITACDGHQAFEYISAHSKELSCVLLDLLMPVMDGFRVLELMNKDAALKQLPVIITSETGSDGELTAMRLGADSFVAKPYNPELLLYRVERAVKESQYRRMCV